MTADIESAIRAIVRDELQHARLSDMPKAVTVKQAAQMTGLSERTIRRLIDRGELPCVRVGGRSIRIRVEDIRRLLDAGR
jgi:excisionase family DNA binding protein